MFQHQFYAVIPSLDHIVLVLNTMRPALYLGGYRLKSWPRDLLSWRVFFMGFP